MSGILQGKATLRTPGPVAGRPVQSSIHVLYICFFSFLWSHTHLYKAGIHYCLLATSASFSDASVKILQIFCRSENVDKSKSNRSQAVKSASSFSEEHQSVR